MCEVTYIYCLFDPADGEMYYIGQSRHPKARLSKHLNGDKWYRDPKTRWVQRLLAKGRKPQMRVLACVPYENAQEHESKWISKALKYGKPLTNVVIPPR